MDPVTTHKDVQVCNRCFPELKKEFLNTLYSTVKDTSAITGVKDLTRISASSMEVMHRTIRRMRHQVIQDHVDLGYLEWTNKERTKFRITEKARSWYKSLPEDQK